jgi:hypothetical protein
MNYELRIAMTVFAAAILASCAPKPETIELFNGRDLTGWVGYLAADSLDTATEFTVSGGVIHLSGKLGYIHTEAVYSDYKLEVEWRWPGEASNSGIFQRVQSEHRPLPECFECQLKSGDAGQIVCLGGARTAETAGDEREIAVMSKLAPSSEKPVGEWNSAEIICRGDEMTITINGTLQNRATGMSLSEGSIGLQSEGGPVEFRNVRLTPLKI